MPTKRFIKQHSQAVHVADRGDVLSPHLLRARIFRGHQSVHNCRGSCSADRFRVKQFSNPKVEQLRDALGRYQNIAGLDVSMNDEILVRVLNRRAHRAEQFKSSGGGESLSVAKFIDGLAFDVFHYEVREATLCRAAIEQTSDVWMIEAGQYLPFVAEAGEHQIRIHPTPDYFDSNLFLILIIIARRQVNSTHPSPTNFAIDLIKSNVLADHGLCFILDE